MKVGIVTLSFLIPLITVGWSKLPYIVKYNCETNTPIRPEWLPDIIPYEYTNILPPNPDGCPTYVRVDVVPFTIGRVSIPDMTFEMDLYVGLLWEDVRLNIPDNFTYEIGLDAETAANIWTPSVSFRNSHSFRSVVKFDATKDKLKIKGRQLFYYVRRFGRFHCNFDISLYPMDQQLCSVEVQSVGEERDTVILLDHVHYYDLLSHSTPTEFTLSEFSSGTCQRPDFTAPALTCIEYRFILSRRCGDHYLMSYLPSILVVILSWLSFWIDASTITPRLAIGLTAMLTMIAHFSIELKEIPPVSYIKAIDIWIFGCLFIVFLSVIEASIAHAFVKRRKKKMMTLSRQQAPSRKVHVQPRNLGSQWGLRRREQVKPYVTTPDEFNTTTRSVAVSDLPPVEEPSVLEVTTSGKPTNNFSAEVYGMDAVEVDCIIDKISRLLFPLMFIAFNVCYWSYYWSKEITLPQEVD